MRRMTEHRRSSERKQGEVKIMKTNKKYGFTMVEIIAVLVIIGIMAAVAAPKFIGMAGDARDKAAVAGVSECKATLSTAYAKAYLQNDGTEPTVAQVLTASGLAVGDETFGDVIVTLALDGTTGVTITTKSVDGTAVTGTAYTWTKPVQD